MAKNPYDPDNPKTKKQLKELRTPWKLWLYFFKHLPSVLFFGVRLKSLTPYKTEVTVPFKWRTQNPFRSIYAGAQFAAAELSAGLMAGHIISPPDLWPDTSFMEEAQWPCLSLRWK